jgi:hypothetical protein
MRYKINELVCVEDTNIPKKITDFENICGTGIYYMSDNTSYSEEQILIGYTDYIDLSDKLDSIIEEKKNIIVNLIDYKKLAKNWAKFISETENGGQ